MLQHGVVALLSFGRRDVADGLQEPPVVEPVHPFQRRELDGFERPPRPAPMDDLGLVETVDCLGESIVITVADAANRRLDSRLRQALGVLDRDGLGGFKWSLQHLDGGGCDEPSKATFGSVWTDAIVFPRSLWCTSPPRWTGRRSWRACSSASSTKPACAVRETRQPTMRRA